MSLAAPNATVAASRQAILAEIGDPPDLTLVRPPGNVGDALIWAGTQALLADRIYTETTLEGLCAARGHTVLLCGGGAFCRPYHEVMPRALAVAELRFERVIVLPSSFDPSEDAVREALVRSRATVFARERESYDRIRSLCDARLAHDGAFFFDYEPHRAPGAGTLNAFRTDREARRARGASLPADNQDISATAPSLEAWLAVIAAHHLIRTDRAHVMIAAALLGKEVEYAASAYHKVPALADYALADFPVRALPAPPGTARRPAAGNGHRAPRAARAARGIAAVVLTRDDPQRTAAAIDSIRAGELSPPVLVIDNNCGPSTARELAEVCAQRDGVSLRRSDRNLGCAGGRALGVELTQGDLVLFLDDDAEFEPGAVDRMFAELAAHPEAAAVTATVTFADGRTHHSGGWMRASQAAVRFGLVGYGQPVTALPASGPVDWVPGTAAMIRRDVLSAVPLDPGMRAYYEDNEWCYRVQAAAAGSFRRLVDARAVHHFTPKLSVETHFAGRSRAVEHLEACAWFHERHGKVLLDAVLTLVPELHGAPEAGSLAAARLLLELVRARGGDWVVMQWLNGGLDVLLSAPRRAAALESERAQPTAELARQAAHAQAQAQAGAREVAALRAELCAVAREREALRASDEMLTRVLAGGWWQARRRVLPALELYRRLRGGRGR